MPIWSSGTKITCREWLWEKKGGEIPKEKNKHSAYGTPKPVGTKKAGFPISEEARPVISVLS